MGMSCSVVIPCHDGVELTRACILSLLAQDDPDQVPSEILVVDNASRDATADLGTLDRRVTVLQQSTNLGFAGGVNRGLRAARGDEVLIVNNDTQAAPNLLRELRAVLTSDPRIGAVAPVSNHVKGHACLPIGALGKAAAARREIAAALAAVPRSQDVESLAGLCLLLQRTTLDQVGEFDERFGHGNFEDDDYCLRLRLRGLRLVIARRAFLHHEGHATFQHLGLDLRTEIERRRSQFVAKWQDDPAGQATIAAWRGDRQAAGRAAQIARTLRPAWPDADWHLGRAAAERGDHRSAAVHFASLLRQCPTHSEAAIGWLDALLADGETAAAEALAARMLQIAFLDRTQAAHVLARTGEHAYRSGRLADARERFTAAVSLRDEDGGLHNWLGLCRLGAGDPAAAADAFTAAVARGCPQGHTNLGICRHALGDADGARAHFARAVELLPGDAAARDNLAAVSAATATALVSR